MGDGCFLSQIASKPALVIDCPALGRHPIMDGKRELSTQFQLKQFVRRFSDLYSASFLQQKKITSLFCYIS